MGLKLETGAKPLPGYRSIEKLGWGDCGEVGKAEGPGGFKVAMKFVSLAEDVGPVEIRALQVIREIRHPHMLATFGSWQIEQGISQNPLRQAILSLQSVIPVFMWAKAPGRTSTESPRWEWRSQITQLNGVPFTQRSRLPPQYQ